MGLELRKSVLINAMEKLCKFYNDKGITSEEFLVSKNIHFLWANIITGIVAICESLPRDSVQRATILFPDPLLNSTRRRQNSINGELLKTLSVYMPKVFL